MTIFCLTLFASSDAVSEHSAYQMLTGDASACGRSSPPNSSRRPRRPRARSAPSSGMPKVSGSWSRRPATRWVVQYRAKGVSRRYTIPGKLAGQGPQEGQGGAGQGDGRARPGGRGAKGQGRGHQHAQGHRRGVPAARGEERRDAQPGRARRIFERYLYPQLGRRQIADIKRSDVTRLLDKIEDDNGPSMADHVLVALRRLMNWHAGRGDDFRSPS